MAMNTHEVIIDCEIADSDVEQIQKKEISIYLLMLPILNDDNISNALNNKMMYYVIDSEWKELGRRGCYRIPPNRILLCILLFYRSLLVYIFCGITAI